MPGAARARPRAASSPPRPRSSSPGCARAWRTTGWARAPACSTSSRPCTARPSTRVLIDFRTLEMRARAAAARRLAARRARLGRAPRARELRLQQAPRRVRARVRAAGHRLPQRRRRACASRAARAAADARRATCSARTRACARPRPRCGGRELRALGALLDASHESLRDLYEVIHARRRGRRRRSCASAGAAGARLIGGGFGGSVLGLFAPGRAARRARPARCAPAPAPTCSRPRAA